jgi:glycosyltransferase involved in cell wall biosynthesis
MKHILFVSHDANRAGAQILLLRFLKLLKEDKRFTFAILLKNGGIIENEFKEIAKTYLWENPIHNHKKSFPVKLLNKLKNDGTYHSQILEKLVNEKFDLIISNTIANGDILPSLDLLNCPIVTYVHELEMGIQQYTQPDLFQNVLRFSSAFIACGEAVKQNLIDKHFISDDKISILPSLLPESDLIFEKDNSKMKHLKNRYVIPENALLVGGMGTVDLRKGVDIFLQVANKLKIHNDIYFLWVGGQESESEYKLFNIDKSRLGLSNVIFQTSVDNPLDYMSVFDIFFVSSREDPYPLVVLEAAMLEKPIICFEKSGGAKDFVEFDCGAVIDYLDIDKVACKIVEFKGNPLLIKQMGEKARKKVLERHNQEHAFKTFVEILESNI